MYLDPLPRLAPIKFEQI